MDDLRLMVREQKASESELERLGNKLRQFDAELVRR